MFIKPLFSAIFFPYLLFIPSFSADGTVPTSQRAKNAIAKTTPPLREQLTKKGLKLGDAVFLRIIKSPKPKSGAISDGVIEVYLRGSGDTYKLFKSLPICTASGTQGPKKKQGDRQSPEGFYFINAGRFNPNSTYHLSLNLGYPNAYDRAHGYTGDYLMVHGKCVSVGC